MNLKLAIIFLSIIFNCGFQLTYPSMVCASEQVSVEEERLSYAKIEQEYGGELVSFPDIQSYLSRCSKGSTKVVCLDDIRKDAFAFSEGIFAITRGLLYEIRNEQELLQLIQNGIEVVENGKTGKIDINLTNKGHSTPEFIRLFHPLWKTEDAYSKLMDAYKLCDKGKYPEALCLAENLLGDLPEEPHLLGLLAKASAGVGNAPGALIELKKALRLNERYYGFYLQRGLLFFKLKVIDGARVDLEESLKLYPTEIAYHTLGKIDIIEGKYQDAVELLSLVADHSTQNLCEVAEVMAHPANSLELTTSLNHFGYIVIEAKNNSPFSLNRLVVSVDSPDNPKTIQFGDQEIKPNKSFKFATNIGPFKRNSMQYQSVHLTIASVKVMDKSIQS